MIQHKICMLGAFAAGKTSLVNQFAHGLFSERYHTTVGVRVEKKSLGVGGTAVDLIIWDLHGEDEFQKLRPAYLRGASGLLAVIDSTRRETVNVGINLLERATSHVGALPSLILVNKIDLTGQLELDSADRARLEATGLPILETSARTGAAVDHAFELVAERILKAA